MKARKVKGLDPDGPLADNARRIVEVRLGELRSFAPRALESGDAETLHDMRIAAKRLRYVLELSEPAFGTAAADGAKAAKKLQDLLGEIHDCDEMLPRVRAHADALRARDAAAVAREGGGSTRPGPGAARAGAQPRPLPRPGEPRHLPDRAQGGPVRALRGPVGEAGGERLRRRPCWRDHPDRASARSSRGPSNSLSSPLSTPATPALGQSHLRAGHPVHRQREVGVVAHQQHPLAQVLSHLVGIEGPAGQALVLDRLQAQRLAASLAVWTARTFGLVTQASTSMPSARKATPAARACSSPFSVRGRSESGEPSCASACRRSQITVGQATHPHNRRLDIPARMDVNGIRI